MKGILLSLVFLSMASAVQTSWQRVKADSNVSIKMHGEVLNNVYKNQKIISSDSDSTRLVLSFGEDNIDFDFQDTNELLKGYDSYIVGYLRSFKNAKVHSTKGLVIDTLIAKKVEFEADVHGERLNIFAAFVIVDNKTYLFQVLTRYSLNDTKDLRKFLDGVDFKDSLTKRDQLN